MIAFTTYEEQVEHESLKDFLMRYTRDKRYQKIIAIIPTKYYIMEDTKRILLKRAEILWEINNETI